MQVGDILIEDGELDAIRQLHAQSAFNYRFPNFPSPHFPIGRSIRHNGEFLAAVLVKLEAEVYLFVNHSAGVPEERRDGLKMLHRDLVCQAQKTGMFTQLYCVLPPEIEKKFGRRMESVGWQKDRGWSRYVYELT